MTLDFGTDTPIAAEDLPGSVVDDGATIGWFNVQRKNLEKFASQYLGNSLSAVEELQSQGQVDTTKPEVIATREGFNEMRTRLPLLLQYYVYTGSHGGTFDTDYLMKIKAIVLEWATVNIPTGKPIDETNYEGLIHAMQYLITWFSTEEKETIAAWLELIAAAKEAWDFTPAGGEGRLLYGNHYTHHYKTLLKTYKALITVYDALGDTVNEAANVTKFDNLVEDEIDVHATFNFPFGNGSVTHPDEHTITAVSTGSKYFQVPGDQTSKFSAGQTSGVYHSGLNDNFYTVASVALVGGDTRITVEEDIPESTVAGVIVEEYDEDIHDMPRAARDAGESIDYIRRDALHYQQYDLEPWLEIAIIEGTGRYEGVVDAAYDFQREWMIDLPWIHYEFKQTTDTFDALRFETSHSQYLQPTSMYMLDDAARLVFAYAYYKTVITENYVQDDKMLSLAWRSNVLSSYWYYAFRWVFWGIYG